MSSRNKNLSQHEEIDTRGNSKYRMGIAVSEYNKELTFAMRDACIATLEKYGVKEKNIFIQLAPGAFPSFAH